MEDMEERPKGWNLTTSDLMDELESGKRKEIGEPEITWASDYERSLIPAHYRFPKNGDLYESIKDQEIHFTTYYRAPFSSGGEAILYKGERIWIQSDSTEEELLMVYALPVDYKALESRIVPEIKRSDERYDGYSLYVRTVELNENFRLIQEDFDKEWYV